MFLATKLWKYYVIVYLFFISSCLSCLANGKHCTENHATKVTKTPKTKLPKYVMSRAQFKENIMKCTKFLPNRAAVFAMPLAPLPFIFTIEGSVCTDTEIVGIWWLWWWLFVPNAELKIKGQVYHVYGYLLKSCWNKITRLWKCDVRRSENVGAENCGK